MIGLKNEGINQLWKHHVCSSKQLPHNSVIKRANDGIKTEFLVSTLLLLSSSPSSTRRFTSERLITHALCYQIVTYWSPRIGNHCDLRSTSLWYSQWSCLSPWEMFYFFFLNIYLSDKPYCFRIYHSNFFFFLTKSLWVKTICSQQYDTVTNELVSRKNQSHEYLNVPQGSHDCTTVNRCQS